MDPLSLTEALWERNRSDSSLKCACEVLTLVLFPSLDNLTSPLRHWGNHILCGHHLVRHSYSATRTPPPLKVIKVLQKTCHSLLGQKRNTPMMEGEAMAVPARVLQS